MQVSAPAPLTEATHNTIAHVVVELYNRRFLEPHISLIESIVHA